MSAAPRPDYGWDAPEIVRNWGLGGLAVLALTLAASRLLPARWWASALVGAGWAGTFSLLMPALTIPLGSRLFKFRERDWLFEKLGLKGSESVLDVGCGRGLLLIGAAKRLPAGRAVGVDLWKREDQAANSPAATVENARREGVADHVEVRDGDMRELPFGAAEFDAVVSSWAIHNVYDAAGRERALLEIERVLKPGGRLAILDIEHAPAYHDFFSARGFRNVDLQGPRFTFGNPTYLLTAEKP